MPSIVGRLGDCAAAIAYPTCLKLVQRRLAPCAHFKRLDKKKIGRERSCSLVGGLFPWVFVLSVRLLVRRCSSAVPVGGCVRPGGVAVAGGWSRCFPRLPWLVPLPGVGLGFVALGRWSCALVLVAGWSLFRFCAEFLVSGGGGGRCLFFMTS